MKTKILCILLCAYSAWAQNYIASWNASPSESYGVVKTYSLWWQSTNSAGNGPGASYPAYINSVNTSPTGAITGGVYQMTIPIGIPNAVNLYLTTDGATNSSIFTAPYFYDTNRLNAAAPLIPPTGFTVKLKLP